MRRPQFSLRALLVFVLVCCCAAWAWKWFAKPEPVEVRVRLGLEPDRTSAHVLRDQQQIRELILEPLRRAEIDPHPARYKFAGSMTLEYRDQSTEGLALFFPFGHFRRGDKYFVADFDRLRKSLRDPRLK